MKKIEKTRTKLRNARVALNNASKCLDAIQEAIDIIVENEDGKSDSLLECDTNNASINSNTRFRSLR